jgi:hypothetical protein
VTDTLQIASDVETLAAGNLNLDGWVAQVTPSSVRAFSLDTTTSTAAAAAAGGSLDWHPPASTTITSGVVSSGYIILQCLCNSQHSLVALQLISNDEDLEIQQLGTPYLLSHEASCIGNLVLSTNNTHAVLAVGTYNASILIFELSQLEKDHQDLECWHFLGETRLRRYVASPLNNEISTTPPVASPAVVGKMTNSTHPGEISISGAEAAQTLEWNRSTDEWQPGSPLAAAARDQQKPYVLKNTTGGTLPASIMAAVPRGGIDYQLSGLELWVSSRSGDVHCLHLAPLRSGAEKGDTLQGEVECVSSRSLHYADLPPTLALLPELKRVSPNFIILAVSERASLLRASSNRGAIEELRLHTPGISCAIALVLEVPAGGDRLFLLAASVDGALSLSSLEAHQRSKVIARPLPWRPDAIATNEKDYGGVPGVVAVAGRKWHHRISGDGQKLEDTTYTLPYVELFDSTTGESLNSFERKIVLIPGEKITGMVLLASDFWERARDHLLKTLPEHLHKNVMTNAGADQKYRCFILASSILDINEPRHRSGGAQGRLLFFAVPLYAGEPLKLLDTLYFPDPVLAVDSAFLVKTEPYREFDSFLTADVFREIAVIATGRRIVSLTVNLEVGGYLVQNTSVSINSCAKALKIYHTSESNDLNGKYISAGCDEGQVQLYMYCKKRDGHPGWNSVLEVQGCSSEVFACVDARFSSEGICNHISLSSSGVIRSNCLKPKDKESKGHCGDGHPLGFVEAINLSAMGDREMLAVTRGGGVVELHLERGRNNEKREGYLALLSKGLLLAVQRAIVEHPEFNFEAVAVKNFLGLSRAPEFYKHPAPFDESTETQQGSEKIATTAEGPSTPAISAEPALKEFLVELQNSNRENEEDGAFKRGDVNELLHLSVLKLFLDSPSDIQRELLLTAVEKVDGGGVEVKDVDIDALAYELAQIGAQNML